MLKRRICFEGRLNFFISRTRMGSEKYPNINPDHTIQEWKKLFRGGYATFVQSWFASRSCSCGLFCTSTLYMGNRFRVVDQYVINISTSNFRRGRRRGNLLFHVRSRERKHRYDSWKYEDEIRKDVHKHFPLDSSNYRVLREILRFTLLHHQIFVKDKNDFDKKVRAWCNYYQRKCHILDK